MPYEMTPSPQDPQWEMVRLQLRSLLAASKVEFSETLWLAWATQIQDFTPGIVLVALRLMPRISAGAYKPSPGMAWHVCFWVRQYGSEVSLRACERFTTSRLPNDSALSFNPTSWAALVRLLAKELAAPEPPLHRPGEEDAFDWSDDPPEDDPLFPAFRQLAEQLRRDGMSRAEAMKDASRRIYQPDAEPEPGPRPERKARSGPDKDASTRVPITRHKDTKAPEDDLDQRRVADHQAAVEEWVASQAWGKEAPTTPEAMREAFEREMAIHQGLQAAADQSKRGGKARPRGKGAPRKPGMGDAQRRPGRPT